MNYLENFLSLPINDHKKFAIAFSNAVREIRSEELGIDFMDLTFEGDTASRKKINQHSIYKFAEDIKPTSITQHLETVIPNWKSSAMVYRGTRLPEDSGSFDFDGVHASVQLNVAKGYANGNVNSSTGIGRLLKHSEGGFITAYKVSLLTPTYKNFEYEDMRKSNKHYVLPTLEQLKSSIEELSRQPTQEFYLDENGCASTSLNNYYNLVGNQSHYEVVIESKAQVENIYFCDARNVYEVNLNNPKWDRLLSRLQEASLRDFYEILPLEKLLQQVEYITVTLDNKDTIDQTKALIEKQKEKALNAPWECSSMKEVSLQGSDYLKSRSYIKNSRCVGSAMDTKVLHLSPVVEKLQNIVEAVRNNELELVNNLFKKFFKDLENSGKKSVVQNISNLRKEYLSCSKLDKMVLLK